MGEVNESDLLIIVACKNPNKVFSNCIGSLRQFYNSKILVVDSDSDKNLEVYKDISEKYENVEIDMVQNKNWEYGAYKYGFEKYPNYKMYLCFQESILIRKKIKLKENNIYLIPHISGWKSFRQGPEIGINLVKDTKLLPYYKRRHQARFMLCAHDSFIVDNKTIKELFNTLTVPPSNKFEAMAYERLFGIFFEKNSGNIGIVPKGGPKQVMATERKSKDIINIKYWIVKIHQKKD